MEGRQAVLTGASAGVGRAVAHCLAQSGAAIALLARDAAALAVVKEEVEALGGKASAVPVDVADADAVSAAADRAAAELGPLSIWINCAMVTVFSPLDEMSADEYQRVTDVTYLGYVHGTMAALRHMRRSNQGVIVQVGSALAYRGIPLQSAYCGAKHAVRGFTDALRCELLHQGSAIRLVMVHLPAVNTPQFDWARTHMAQEPRPVGPVVQPEVAARAIVGAISGSSREIWLGRSTFATIIGNMIWPAYMDSYLARNAFDAQATSDPVTQDRPDNLFAPVTKLHRTRGRFDGEASISAPWLAGTVARFAVIAAGATIIIALAGMLGASLFG
jgi:NAD(P)-dependent dehydrogenase (short-subunit alcohol dehydrogenase family)